MRSFITLDLPAGIELEIEKIQKNLEAKGIKARLVNPANIHLTLAFLDSITSETKNLVIKRMEEASFGIKPIRFRFSRIDCFPNRKKARIIFADMSGNLEELNRLVNGIRKQLKKEKIFFDEKPFKPHITIGRMKKKQILENLVDKISMPSKEFEANSVSLMESRLTASGPIYARVQRIFLTRAEMIKNDKINYCTARGGN